MSKKTFYVTTPIYYPSGNLHIGHVYTTSLAWVLRNYKRANGYDAIMLTGADEHGQKIEIKAKNLNILPQEYVNKMYIKFKKLWKLFAINYDIYSRTTDKNHIESVKKQFSFLYENNKIFKGSYKGLYSINDEEFLTKINALKKKDGYYHPLSGHKLQEIQEESYFFKMSNYQTWIKKYFHENPDFIFPKKIVKELLNNFINNDLEDLSISRKSFKWGISINEDPKHIIYVWFDALNNYITALGYNQKDDHKFKKYWLNGDEIVHIIGKEISRFHCIYWPIILNANGIRQPTKILSHGWIVTPKGKMSKSKGNIIDPLDLIKKYGNEQIKYYLVSQINIGQDGVFEKNDFINTINSDLSNNIGNLVSRAIAMTLQNFQKPIKFLGKNNIEDTKILNIIKNSFNNYKKYFDEFNISSAIREAIFLSKKLNGYIDITSPWKLKDDKIRLEKILNILLNGIYAVITMLNVVMPQFMKKAQKQLNISELSFVKVLNFNKFDKILVKYGDIIFTKI